MVQRVQRTTERETFTVHIHNYIRTEGKTDGDGGLDVKVSQSSRELALQGS